MLLQDRMRLIASDVASLRKSFQIVTPGAPGANVSEGISRNERLIRLRSREGLRRTMQLAALITDIGQGRRPSWHMQEAMGTDDFPLLFGDLLYRQLLGNYVPWPVTYPSWMRVMDVKDFRDLHLYTLDGGQSILPQVKEHEPYPEVAFTEGEYALSVLKYGQRYGISFEMVIQDDLNAFAGRPMMMATGARRSEEYLATTKLCDVNGPHASFFTSGNANLASGALTIKNLQTAFKKLSAQRDVDGQPVMINAVTLLVTPNDEITAKNILGASQIRVNAASGGGDADQFLYTDNWMRGRVTLQVNPYIPYVASSCASNPWFLIADPSDLTQRPAFAFGFLRGRRQPQLFVKDPDAMMIGGGASSPLEGNFDNDDINYKIRHIFGATQVDPKMAVASIGA